MKRALVGTLVSIFFATAAARAADAVTIAAQQEAQYNYKALAATVEEVQTSQQAQQKSISALATEVSKLRDETARNNNDAATKESIRKLSDEIRKVDEARVADNKRIYEALEKLGEAIKKMPVAAPPRRSTAIEGGTTTVAPAGNAVGKLNTPRSNTNGSGAADESLGFDYTVQSGDVHLGVIVKRYNDEKIPVTKAAIMAANPNVDWTRLKIGQKIFIPKPK